MESKGGKAEVSLMKLSSSALLAIESSAHHHRSPFWEVALLSFL
jgi:hypothetical protein